jgi:riboflavin transporter FmnP
MEEVSMNLRTSGNSPVNIVALGWGLSAVLVVLFVICLAVALVLPDWQASHGWIGLFSVAPMTSVRVWIDGIVFSIVFGWISAVVFGLVYNRLIR